MVNKIFLVYSKTMLKVKGMIMEDNFMVKRQLAFDLSCAFDMTFVFSIFFRERNHGGEKNSKLGLPDRK